MILDFFRICQEPQVRSYCLCIEQSKNPGISFRGLQITHTNNSTEFTWSTLISSIRTVTVGTGFAPVQPSACMSACIRLADLCISCNYRRWGLSPRPETDIQLHFKYTKVYMSCQEKSIPIHRHNILQEKPVPITNFQERLISPP